MMKVRSDWDLEAILECIKYCPQKQITCQISEKGALFPVTLGKKVITNAGEV